MPSVSVPARRVMASFVILLLSGLLIEVFPPETSGPVARTRSQARPASVAPRGDSDTAPPARVLSTETTRRPSFTTGGAYPAGAGVPAPQDEVVFFVAAESSPFPSDGSSADVTWLTLAVGLVGLAIRSAVVSPRRR